MLPESRTPIDVLIPVYRGLDETRRCLDSVLEQPQESAYDLIVIDDAGPEPELATYLDGLASSGRITLLRNDVNRGFVATVNRGLVLHPERDVALLNSDTEVHGNWLDRLRRCAYCEVDIGTVTPFSNNATICSYPRPGMVNDLPPGMTLADLDSLFSRVNAGRWVEIPTGVGFCMYIRRACLQAVGYLDEGSFGLGYGEENDFCMRARKKSWRHALCGDAFVYHRGGVSFGERHPQLREQAQATLAELHPVYGELVRAFIWSDPARPLRLAVDRERALGSPEGTVQVLMERDSDVAGLTSKLEEETTLRERLQQGLKEAEHLLHRARDDVKSRDEALVEAQRYVRKREAQVSEAQQRDDYLESAIDKLKLEPEKLKSELKKLHFKLAAVHDEKHALEAQLKVIYASRSWRYTALLRRP